MATGQARSRDELLANLAPLIFVLLWSTGFIGARYTLPYVDPFTLLLIRFVIAFAILLLLLRFFRPEIPSQWKLRGHLMASGLLVHGAYLGGVFYAIKHGMPAGVCALIVGLQPILTVVVSPLVFGRLIPRLHQIGVILGFVGIVLVLGDRSTLNGFGSGSLLAALIALAGITAGTLYQKKISAGVDILSIALFQYMATAALFSVGAFAFESGIDGFLSITWHPELLFGLLWLVFGLSIGAILLLNYLIHNNEAHKVTSLFYLVPPLTVLEAYLLFDEQLGVLNLFGMGVVAIAVYLVMRKPATAQLPDD